MDFDHLFLVIYVGRLSGCAAVARDRGHTK